MYFQLWKPSGFLPPKWQKTLKKHPKFFVAPTDHLFGTQNRSCRHYHTSKTFLFIFYKPTLFFNEICLISVCIVSYEHLLGPKMANNKKKRWQRVLKNFVHQLIIFSGHKIAVADITTPPKHFYSYSRDVWGHSPLFFCKICLISVCIFSYEHLLGSNIYPHTHTPKKKLRMLSRTKKDQKKLSFRAITLRFPTLPHLQNVFIHIPETF